jgi:hypothetical protein
MCSSSLTVSPSFYTCYLYIQSYDSTPMCEQFCGILYNHAIYVVLLTFISYYTIYYVHYCFYAICFILYTFLGSQTYALPLNTCILTLIWFNMAWWWLCKSKLVASLHIDNKLMSWLVLILSNVYKHIEMAQIKILSKNLFMLCNEFWFELWVRICA